MFWRLKRFDILSYSAFESGEKGEQLIKKSGDVTYRLQTKLENCINCFINARFGLFEAKIFNSFPCIFLGI